MKSFSGATTSDKEDYLKPITRKCPESLILHVGTNDLLSIQTPQQIAESIVNLADQIESNSPGTHEIKPDKALVFFAHCLCRNFFSR